MEPLVTFHILPCAQWGKVEIIIWERSVGEVGWMEISTATWDRLRPFVVPGPGVRIRQHRPSPR
jgi:hypothetical protein